MLHYKNFPPVPLLVSGISDVATTISLSSVEGIPDAPSTIAIGREIIRYEGISGNTLTECVRGYDSTAAAPHPAGSRVQFVISAGVFSNIPAPGAGSIGIVDEDETTITLEFSESVVISEDDTTVTLNI